MHKARRITSLGKHLLHQRLLADVAFAYMLNLNSRLRTNFLGTFANPFTQRLRELWVVKNTNALAVQKTGHAIGLAGPRHGACNQNAVVARKHSMQIGRVSLRQLGAHDLASSITSADRITCLVPARPA